VAIKNSLMFLALWIIVIVVGLALGLLIYPFALVFLEFSLVLIAVRMIYLWSTNRLDNINLSKIGTDCPKRVLSSISSSSSVRISKHPSSGESNNTDKPLLNKRAFSPLEPQEQELIVKVAPSPPRSDIGLPNYPDNLKESHDRPHSSNLVRISQSLVIKPTISHRIRSQNSEEDNLDKLIRKSEDNENDRRRRREDENKQNS